ncbi:hypothetical protein BKH31_01560 [Actinomyces oris]|uniref:Uncharacterized protein n=1 Tax=Actinomyces oris TaxID=544580 RepID=A0A1Q8VL66_9ACTO|nr:hypothetical protein [Actinomyces oris]OLO48847.1 hypothetical protein BKH31_01560 [Actinomyces oris]
MQYAQRLLAALPSTRAGLRAILAVLTAFGIVLATAGVAAMPLLNGGRAVEDSENGSACHPAARMVYPEGQSAPEYVVPVYEAEYGVDSILSDWCGTAGEVLENPTITLNVVEGKTITPYLLPGIKAELERPAPTNGEQNVFIPTDYLVKGVRQVTGDSGWEVGTKIFSLTYTSGTVSATTGLFSFVKQDPGAIDPPSPKPTPEPTTGPSAEPSEKPGSELPTEPLPQPTAELTTEPIPQPTAEPKPEPTPEPSAAPTAEPTPEATTEPSPAPSVSPTPTPSPTPSAAPSPSASPSTTASPSSSPSPSQSPKPEPTASAQPSASPSATVKTCQAKPTVQVLSSDGSDPQGSEPAYDPETAVRVRGTGWCSQGTMLDGEKPVEIKVAAYGGYVVPGTLSVPVTFHHGSFDAQLNLSALYSGGKVDKGRYYLQFSPIDSGLTAATNVFALNKAVAPQPKPEPSPAPSPAPTATAEPSATAQPTSEPAPEPTGSPTSPAPTPSAAPSSEPSASAAPSARPSETASPAPAPHTTGPDQNTQRPNPDGGGRPGTDNAPGNNPGGNQGDTGSGAGSGTGTGAGGQGDSSAPQAPDAGSDSRSSTSQDGSDPDQANAGAVPAPNAGGSGAERPHASEDSAASAKNSPGADASSQRTVRPDRSPVAPVSSAAHLNADNAGSLSGSRQGNIVNLVLPKSKVQSGEWVSVFVFPGATTKGWVQVDDANSVSIDISTFDSGSYELAVADRDNGLLGWAKLEISSASFDPRNPAQAQLLTFPDKAAAHTKGLSANDVLLGSAGGLLVVGAVSLLVAAFSGMPLRVPRTSPQLRLPRRH